MKPKTLRNIEELNHNKLVTDEEVALLQKVADNFNVAITPAMVTVLQDTADSEAIRRQFIPSAEELLIQEDELSDPIGDHKFEQVKGLIHRYPDRCLLKVVNICPVYCRFCFRKEMIGAGKGFVSAENLQDAFDYIQAHPKIWEVILSGGDPLILKPARLQRIMLALNEIKHVEILRIHTRIPVVDPERITDSLIRCLKVPKALYVVLHANHPSEFTASAIDACARIVDAGIPMLSQSVLLKGVNDQPETLSLLMKTFLRNRIKPYYLHHPDKVKGTSHLRVNIEQGQALMRQLQGNYSGLCQPHYVLDIPGGAGKVPIGPCYWCKIDEGKWLIKSYLGDLHSYED